MKKLGFILLFTIFLFLVNKEQIYANDVTLKEFIKIAMQPVGQTMYVWGGGWNKADTGAGIEALTIGVSPNWKAFFEKQNRHYNFEETRYMIHSGLDCSGYVGWILFNLIPNRSGYVMKSGLLIETLVNLGWGQRYSRNTKRTNIPGDIMGSTGHVWISLGTCRDGSVLILQSSPPGVSLYGTQIGGQKSDAVALAELYMRRYFPLWHTKFQNYRRNNSFLTDYDMFRWDEGFLLDPDGYRTMDPASILRDLFGET
jgi:hypothetical protein